MSLRKPPVGLSDFKKLREEDRYYVDKSLFIQKVWESGADVLLFPRPRRFGKTLNLSMLRYFFEKTEISNSHIFEGLEISKQIEIMARQGQYPLIYLTFKDVKESSWENCLEQLRHLLVSEVFRHIHQINCTKTPEEERILKAFAKHKTNIVDLQRSIYIIMSLLNRSTGKKVILLIDEYDTPIHAGHQYGYYEEIILFMRNLLSGAFKDNSHLQKGVITGVLRVSKESIFTGLNNISVNTILCSDFSNYFGFTEIDIEKIMNDFSVENSQEVKDWYNGYIFGSEVVYNPWSILNFLNSKDRRLQPFWIDSSGNDLVRDLILQGPVSLRENIEILLRGGSISSVLHENIVLRDIAATEENILSLLTFSGYLKASNPVKERNRIFYDLSIPNIEVMRFYEDTIQIWLNKQIGDQRLQRLLKSLINEDIEAFEELLQDITLSILSYHDTSGDEPERVYHAFVLGLLINLSSKYQIRSNREAGYGRYDVTLIPYNPQQTGFIFEFKKINNKKEKSQKVSMQNALNQIKEKEYVKELHQAGVNKIMGIGVVVNGKKVKVESVKL